MKGRTFKVATGATVAAALVIIGISAFNVSACNYAPAGYAGHHSVVHGGANGQVDQQLLEDTRATRKEMAADYVELNALLAGPNPDGNRVRELSEKIAAGKLQLERVYSAAGYGEGYDHRGYGMMTAGSCCW